jgi:hypothetical protein
MNIDELYTVDAHDKGAEMQVLDQFGKEIDMYFTIIGVDSKKWRSLQKQSKSLDNEDIEATANILKEAIIGWRGVQSKGKDVKFSKDMAFKVLMNAPYLMAQIISFIVDRTNFMKG